MKFFVSYSRSVQDSVRQIIASLRDDGEEVWWDQDLRSGQDWWATILDHIEASEVCLFMISEKAVQSPYCLEELRYGLARNRLILPFVLDGPVAYTIPPEIMKGRIQYEIYSGRPAHLKDRIRITCKAADWTQYKDRFAVRPPEPNTGSSNLADRLAKAIALAQEGMFESAVEGFTDVAHNDHATFGDFCHAWIEKINRYKEIVSLSSHAAMKRLVLPKWAAFLKQYAEDDPFDPLGVEEKLAIKKVTAPGPESSPDELQKVYDLIEEARKAHIENVPFGADPALYALGDMGEVAVIPILALLQDESPLMRESAVNLLGNIGDDRAIEPLIEMLQDSIWDVRWAACHMLPRFEDVRAIEPLIGMLKDPQAEVRDMAASALAVFEDPRAVEPLIALLQDENEKVRASAGEALKRLGYVPLSPADEKRIEELFEAVRESGGIRIQVRFAQQIKNIGVAALSPLIRVLEDSNHNLRKFATNALGNLGDKRAVQPLIKLLDKNDWATADSAIRALGALKDKRAIPVLTQVLSYDDEWFSTLAKEALEKIRAANPDA